jgi:hypothetical protein
VKYILIESITLRADWERKVLNISPFSSCFSVLKSNILEVISYLGFRKLKGFVAAGSTVPVILVSLVSTSFCVFSLESREEESDSTDRTVADCGCSSSVLIFMGSFLLCSVKEVRPASIGFVSTVGLGSDIVFRG